MGRAASDCFEKGRMARPRAKLVGGGGVLPLLIGGSPIKLSCSC